MRNLTNIGLIAIISIGMMSPVQASTWVEKSNEHAQVVLDLLAKLSPEGAGSLGRRRASTRKFRIWVRGFRSAPGKCQ